MVEKIKFENSTGKDMQICIEPFAEYLEWGKGREIEIQFKRNNDRYKDELNIALTEQSLIIYECRQFEMTVSIENEQAYSTPKDRYL
jgi:hypothetical protein